MDLFGPVNVLSISRKRFCLVIVDDFSKFSWTYFLKSKDEASEIIINHIRQVNNHPDFKVRRIRSDNGTEFKNSVMRSFCEENGIMHEFSASRTPQQNGVVERKNRSLIEATRTMLEESKLPTYFWAEAVNTACYTQNISLINQAKSQDLAVRVSSGSDVSSGFGMSSAFGCHWLTDKFTIRNDLNMSLNKFESIKIPILKKAEYPTWKVKMLMHLESTDPDYLNVINDGPSMPTKLVPATLTVAEHYQLKEKTEWTLE
ncbi:hypothetical protein AgCh_016733 [Apium graveolens]